MMPSEFANPSRVITLSDHACHQWKELNNEPNQAPGRSIINFRDWPLEKVQEYSEPYERVLKRSSR